MVTEKREPAQMEVQKSLELLYSEGCSSVRHYSLALRSVRTISIAQGFAVLTGVFFLAKENQYYLSSIASVFGLVLTTIMYKLHRNYYVHVKSVAEYVTEFEEKHMIEKAGPWKSMNNARAEHWKNPVTRFVINNGMYYLLGTTLLLVIGLNTYQSNASDAVTNSIKQGELISSINANEQSTHNSQSTTRLRRRTQPSCACY